MDQQQFRGVLAAVLVVAVVAGLWLGWHFTHLPAANPSCRYQGQTLHGFARCP